MIAAAEVNYCEKTFYFLVVPNPHDAKLTPSFVLGFSRVLFVIITGVPMPVDPNYDSMAVFSLSRCGNI